MPKILCIDDNNDNLLVLKALLSEQFSDIEQIFSNNSKEGITNVFLHKPDLILLDIVMPDIDGYEVCTQIKANETTKDIPVVMITATNTHKAGRIKALESGADGFLTKPIDPSELTAQVRAMLKIKASHDEKLKEQERLKILVSDRTIELEQELKERKKVEKELRKVERYQKTLISNLPGFVYKCLNDEFWTMLYISDGCQKITGYSPYEFLNNQTVAYGKIIQSDFLDEIRENWRISLTQKTMFEHQYLITTKSGEKRWVWERGQGVFDENNNFLHLDGFITDITEKKKADEGMLMRDRIFYHSLDMICIAGFDGYFKILNPAWKKTLGWETEELLSKPWSDFVHPDDKHRTDHITLHLKDGVEVFQFENRYVCKDGSIRWLSWNSHPYTDEKIMFGVARDITQQKIAEEQLIKSEDRFRAISEYAQNAICIVNENGKITWGNQALEKLGGFQLNEIYKANSFIDFIAPESQDFVKNNFISFASKKEYLKSYVFYFIRSDGQKKLCEKHMTDFTDIDGHRNLAISMIDITESDKSSKILRIQYNIAKASVMSEDLNDLFDIVRAELSTIIDTSNFIIAFYNEQTNMLNRIYGVDQQEFIGEWPAENSLSGRVIKQSKSQIFSKSEIQKMADDNSIKLMGKRAEMWLGIPLIAKNKTFGVIILQSYHKHHSFDHQSIEILEIIANQLSLFIERKNIQQTALQLLKGVEKSPVCTIITDIDARIQYVNPMFSEVSGFSQSEVIGKKTSILNSGKNSLAVYNLMWKTILEGKEWSGELLNKRKNGSHYWAMVNISPIVDKSGKISHFITLQTDISNEKKMLEDLILAKEKAEESDRLKTAFLHSISHEIRTPMNGIMGFTELLFDQDTTESEKTHYASIINNSCQQLLSVITDMINIAAIEAGQEKISEQAFSIFQEMNDLYQQFSLLAKQKNLDLKFNYELSINESNIYCDKRKLIQILSNLLTNALKYTPSGQIILGCKLNNNLIEFYVKDTGIGIEKKYQHCVFDRFRQIENPLTQKSGGTGLGLAISKAYAELMGGKITLISKPNIGSRFSLFIPYVPKNDLNEEINEFSEIYLSKLKGRTILIAEDDPTNFLILKTMMRHLNFQIIHAENGLDAINTCRKQSNIDLILMDIKMPVMDGIEATKIIKQDYPNMPVVAQTAFALEGDKDKMLDAGCDNYLSKPISKKELYHVLEKYLMKKK